MLSAKLCICYVFRYRITSSLRSVTELARRCHLHKVDSTVDIRSSHDNMLKNNGCIQMTKYHFTEIDHHAAHIKILMSASIR